MSRTSEANDQSVVRMEARASGAVSELAVQNWSAPATESELRLLADVGSPVLDVGCGPGRIAAALGERGIAALGIDVAPAAIRAAGDAGASVLDRSVFDRLPGEGRWSTVLLLDGNVGIGGDPVALLRRCGELVSARGEVVVEVGPPGSPTVFEEVRLLGPAGEVGPWFEWAQVGADEIRRIATDAGLRAHSVEAHDGRHFARLSVGAEIEGAPSAPGVTLMVIAKEPVAGMVKTRLCPPCSPEEAATIAEAALADTFEAVAGVSAARHVAVLEGSPGEWLPPGFDVVAQVSGSLGDRLAAAFAGVGGPAIVVGMDTPQMGSSAVARAASTLLAPGVDAVLGPALDGGYWTIGLRRGTPGAFDGVPMSRSDTGELQRRRLCELGLRVDEVDELRDIDHWDDAVAVAEAHPELRMSQVVRGIRRGALR